MTKKCIAARRRYKKNKRKIGAGWQSIMAPYMKLAKTPGTAEYARTHVRKQYGNYHILNGKKETEND